MSTLADSLNLRPQEKRIIAVIAVVVFVVLNLVLVFPHFKDYRIIQAQLKKTQLNIITNRLVIALDKKESGGLKEQLRLLQTGKGGPVGDKEIQLQQMKDEID